MRRAAGEPPEVAVVNTSEPVDNDPEKARVEPSGDNFKDPVMEGTIVSLKREAASGTLPSLLKSKDADQMAEPAQKKRRSPCKAGEEIID